jgi:hypothetical protein
MFGYFLTFLLGQNAHILDRPIQNPMSENTWTKEELVTSVLSVSKMPSIDLNAYLIDL